MKSYINGGSMLSTLHLSISSHYLGVAMTPGCHRSGISEAIPSHQETTLEMPDNPNEQIVTLSFFYSISAYFILSRPDNFQTLGQDFQFFSSVAHSNHVQLVSPVY